MKVYTSLSELEDSLPSGFHDATLETVTINYAANNAELALQLSVGDPDAPTEEERHAFKGARLHLTDLVYFVIDPPGPGHQPPGPGYVWLDAGDATDESNPQHLKPRSELPADAFAYWFFVGPDNSFIHIAAKSASLEWL